MKNGALVLALSILLGAFAPPPAWAAKADWTGDLNFTVGVKALDEDDWEPVDDQAEVGINADFRSRSWPVSLAVGLRASTTEENDVVMPGVALDTEGSTKELRFGLCRIWEPTASMRPFFGGGLAAVSAEFERRSLGITERNHDTGTGLWLSGGVYWTFGAGINLGFEVGYSQARISLFDEKHEAGGTHASLLMGSHW